VLPETDVTNMMEMKDRVTGEANMMEMGDRVTSTTKMMEMGRQSDRCSPRQIQQT
jgi:hypothetical protein